MTEKYRKDFLHFMQPDVIREGLKNERVVSYRYKVNRNGKQADEILITENMLRKGDDVFLDDMTLSELQERLGIPVIPVPNDGGDLLYALRGTEE